MIDDPGRSPGMRTPKTPHGPRLVIPEPRQGTADPMAALTPLQLRVLRMRVVEGRTAEQVAVLLDMSPRAVRVTQHKALETLRAYLKAADDQPDAG